MDLDGGADHSVIADGLSLLMDLEHRGALGAEENTGDGAGIVLQIPREFFAEELDIELPETYAVGAVFLPQGDEHRADLKDLFEARLSEHGLSTLCWRPVPTENDGLGETALDSEPHVSHVVVTPKGELSAEEFDRRLYIGRRDLENTVRERQPAGAERFYVCSLDRRTLVYKGLLTASQLREYYPDLRDERLTSTFVMVHARFSTNTLGAWHLAHPYRSIIHNGEINTIQGNINWMRARETDLASDALDEGSAEPGSTASASGRSPQAAIETIRPIIDDPDQSDTASVDNTLELLM
jgi:glutamate synthase (NADPH/NADH) large chain